MKEEKEENKLSELQLKAKALGAVYCIIVVDGERELSLYLKQPHRDIVGVYYGMKDANPIKAAEVLLKASCLMDISDKEIFSSDDNFYSAYIQIDNYLDVIKLKKSRSFNL